MYVVKAKNAADNGWTTIYDSSDKALCLISQPKHSSELNQPGSFDFTIYPDSDFYDAVVPMDTFISAFEGTDAEHLEETFYGRVLTCEDDYYGIKNVNCEGAFMFLKDATVGRVSTDDKNSGREYQTSPQAFLQEQLTAYNSRVEDRKKLLYGGTSGITTSDAENFKIDDNQDFKSLLESQLIDVLGGFFKIARRQDGKHELSYVKNYGINVGTAQTIKIGQNILDKQKHATGEGVFTFIRPVGKDGVRLNDGVYHGVTCNSANGRSGLYPVGTDAASFNALYARYGFIEKTKSFEDCETSDALASSCSKYVRDYGLDSLGKLPMSFDVKLVDFFNANPGVKRIELGANYILTVDREGRETGFEGHADGAPLQEGQEGLTLTVYSVNREYESPENDSITFYNATYLTAKDYSIILSSMTGSYSGSSGGGGYRGGLSGLMASRDAEEQEQQKNEKRRVEKRFIDDEDSIGMVISITEDGKVINAGGIWTEITGTDKNLLQGTLDVDLVALRSNALITAINRGKEQSEPTQLTIDFDKVNITGDLLVESINDQRTGTAQIKADRIKIDSTSGSSFSIDENGKMTFNAENAIAAINAAEATINANRIKLDAKDTITLNALLGIEANTGYLRVNGSLSVKNNIYATDNISLGDTLIIGESTGTQGDETGRLFFRGTEYFEKPIRMGVTSPFIVSGRVLADSVKDVIDLNHSHAVSMTEQTIGANAGKVHAVIGEPVTYSSSSTANRESFFDIAASQTYLNGVAAARDSIQAVLNGTSSKPTSGRSAGSATEGWYYQALTSYSGTESYTRKYGGYVYVPKYTVTKGSWNNGDITFTRETTTGTPSTSQSVSLSLSAVQMVSTDPNKWTVTAYDGNRNTGESVEVDATSRYTAGETAGKNAVTINKGTWNAGKIDFTKSEGTASTKSVQLAKANTSWNGNTASVELWDGTSADAQHGVKTGYTVTVDATSRYTAGETAGKNAVTINKGTWNAGKIDFTKSEGTASTKSVSLSVTATQKVSTDPNKWAITVKDGNADTGASIEVDATSRYEAGRIEGESSGRETGYGNGWAAARTSVGDFPASTPTNIPSSITVKKPNATVDGTAASYEYNLSVDNDYAYLKYSGNTVARVSNTAYGNGYSSGYSSGYGEGMNDVGVCIAKNSSQVSSWTLQSGDSETFYPAKLIDGGLVIDYNNGLTVTASGGSSRHDIRITASIRGGNRPVTTEIFSDAGAYEDLHNARPGYYNFKVTCGDTEKWYYFRVGNP